MIPYDPPCLLKNRPTIHFGLTNDNPQDPSPPNAQTTTPTNVTDYDRTRSCPSECGPRVAPLPPEPEPFPWNPNETVRRG